MSIFTGLTGLEVIDLSNNRLTAPLPDKVFSGLSNLRALYLDRNADDPMVMTVSLATDGASGVKAVMPTGAPFTMLLPVNVAEGSIPGGNEIMISTGATESGVYQVTSNTRTVQNPAVTIASLPALPPSHIGYELRDSGEQPPTITDTDLPAFSITDAWGNEPDSDVSGSGGGYIEFTITLSGTLAEDARVSYATSVESGQTATSGEDFSTTRGSKLFLAGTTRKTFKVYLHEDISVEDPETFTVTLSDPTPNTRLDENSKSAVGYILDPVAVPRLIIDDASVEEGSGPIDFNITLSRPSMHDSMVQYTTSVEGGQTATPGTDFEAVTGTATIAAWTTTTTISIPVEDDDEEEPDETFTVTLSDPSRMGLPRRVSDPYPSDPPSAPSWTMTA